MRPHPLLALATTTALTAGSFGVAGVAAAATPPKIHPRTTAHATVRTPLARLSLSTSAIPLGSLGTHLLTLSSPTGRRATRAVAGASIPQPFARTLGALRECESGGNYGEDTGNGFYGAYQFAPQTWRAIGFAGLPNAASPAVQDRAAFDLVRLEGFRPWPVCAAELGLEA